MAKTFGETIYKEKKSILYYIKDCFPDILVTSILLLLFLFYSFFTKNDFFAIFKEGDFFWSAFGVFTSIIISFGFPSKKFSGLKKFNYIFCIVVGILCAGCYFIIKITINQVDSENYFLLFIISISVFLLAEGCRILSKFNI